MTDPTATPDFIILYAHGGGFSMGSTWFYLEFLLSWVSLLISDAGYRSPAVFGLEYTLVPDARYPAQLREALAAYRHVLETAGGVPERVCVAGDSAGATIMLSLLLELAGSSGAKRQGPNGAADGAADVAVPERACRVPAPGMAVLISPWTTLISPRHRNNASDYLDARSLYRYGLQYAGEQARTMDPRVSPGYNRDVGWWRRAAPQRGIFVTYGEEEVLAPEIIELTATLEEAGVLAGKGGARGGIHAWPVASLFLASSREERLRGLRDIVDVIRKQDSKRY